MAEVHMALEAITFELTPEQFHKRYLQPCFAQAKNMLDNGEKVHIVIHVDHAETFSDCKFGASI